MALQYAKGGERITFTPLFVYVKMVAVVLYMALACQYGAAPACCRIVLSEALPAWQVFYPSLDTPGTSGTMDIAAPGYVHPVVSPVSGATTHCMPGAAEVYLSE